MPEEGNLPNTPPVTQLPNPVDVEALLAKVREEEKSKLYPALEKEKNKVKEAEAELQTIKAQLKELQSFREAAELEKLDEKSRLEREKQLLQDKLQEEARSRELERQNFAERIKVYELGLLKTQLVRAAGIDPDLEVLVVGNTEDELRTNLQKAVALDTRIKEKLTPAPQQEQQQSPYQNLLPQASRPASPYPNLLADSPDIRNVTNEKELIEFKRKVGLIP